MAGFRKLYFTVDPDAFRKALERRWMTVESLSSMGTFGRSTVSKAMKDGRITVDLAFHICNALDLDVEDTFGKQGADSDFDRLHEFTKRKKVRTSKKALGRLVPVEF